MEPGSTSNGGGQRLLAAIVFTDAVGFSARVGSDEEGTVELIKKDLDFMVKACQQYEGQVIKSRGDGLMMMFTSAVQAVNCALDIQKAFNDRVKENPAANVLMHRIGIHLGDVLVADGDALGDGVNVAARLESEAEAGGICMSQTVYDVVRNRLFLDAVKVGDLRLKNIADPVPAYKVAGVGKTRKSKAAGTPNWAAYTVLGIALIVLGIGAGAIYFAQRSTSRALASVPSLGMPPPMMGNEAGPMRLGGPGSPSNLPGPPAGTPKTFDEAFTAFFRHNDIGRFAQWAQQNAAAIPASEGPDARERYQAAAAVMGFIHDHIGSFSDSNPLNIALGKQRGTVTYRSDDSVEVGLGDRHKSYRFDQLPPEILVAIANALIAQSAPEGGKEPLQNQLSQLVAEFRMHPVKAPAGASPNSDELLP